MEELSHHCKFIYFAINTYDSISPHAALRFGKTAYEELLTPFTSEGMDFWSEYYRSESHRPRSFMRDMVQWDKVQAAFPLHALALGLRIEGNQERLPDREIGNLGVYFSENPNRASSLEFGAVSEKLYSGPPIPPFIQSKVVDLAISTFEEVNGVTGYITHDYIGADCFGNDSPYERWLGYTYRWSSLDFRERTRGYYWGNFITQGHLQKLGGVEVLKTAPVALSRRVGDGYYLQLTDDINNIDRMKLRQLKQFFAPILPQLPPDWPRISESDRHRLFDYTL